MKSYGRRIKSSRRDVLRGLAGAAAVSGLSFPSSAFAADPLKIGVVKVPQWAAAWLAPELMKAPNAGRLIEFKTSSEEITAFNAGSVDVANVGYWHFLRMLDQGFNIRAIAGLASGGTRILVRKGVQIDSWADFRNKACGMTRGTTQEVQFLVALKKFGISKDNIKYQELGANAAVYIQALQQGQVDAVSFWEPFASEMLLQNVAVEFKNLYENSFSVNGLVCVTPEFLEKNREGLEALVRAQVEATNRLLGNFDEFTDFTVKMAGLSRETMALANKNSILEYKLHLGEARKLAGALHEFGHTKADVTSKLDVAFDYSILSKVTGKDRKELGG